MGVVEDDERAPRCGELRELGHHRGRLRCVMEKPSGEYDVCSATDGAPHFGTGELPFDQRDIRVASESHAFFGPLELREGAIDPHDALEGGRENVEKAAVSRACVDREIPMRKKRGEGREVGANFCRRTGELIFFALAWLREVLAGHGISRAEHFADPSDASIGIAERATTGERIGDHRITRRIIAQTKEGACSLTAHRQEARLLQRRRMARYVRLTLPEELGELEDRELLLGAQRKETEPRRLGEHAVEIPAGRNDRSVEHGLLIT